MSDGTNIERVLAQMRTLAARSKGLEPKADEVESFGDMLQQSIEHVNSTQQRASEMATRFETGEGDTGLEQVMVALQKSNLSFQTMVQVRNKLVDAYKDVMNMSI